MVPSIHLGVTNFLVVVLCHDMGLHDTGGTGSTGGTGATGNTGITGNGQASSVISQLITGAQHGMK